MLQKTDLRKVKKILFVCLLVFLGLILLSSVLINITPVQNFLVHKVSNKISSWLKTDVHIDHVKIKLFNTLETEGIFIADEQKDTLFYAQKLNLNITDLLSSKRKTDLTYIGLEGAVVHLNRTIEDSSWNYQFIVDRLARPEKKNKNGPPNLSFKKMEIANLQLNQKDGYKGENKLISLQSFTTNAKNIDFSKKKILINKVKLEKPIFILEKYEGSEDFDNETEPPLAAADSLALQWNKAHWDIRIGEMDLNNGKFSLIKEGHQIADRYFDPDHISFQDIAAHFKNARLEQDSIISEIELSTKERGGIDVKKLTGRFKMSPITIEVANMDLQTNQGHLKDFFALQFNEFGDLRDFTSKVTMRGDFKDATVFSNDIGFFAPPLLDWNKNVKIDGLVYGPLEHLTGEHITIESGRGSVLKGDFSMTGLPDINNTFINFENLDLRTSGKDLLTFLPILSENEGLKLDALKKISYTGSYVGFIFDFVSFGTLKTNLGSLNTDVNFKIGKNRKTPGYRGYISSEGFDLGTLLELEDLGQVAFNTRIEGEGFSVDDLNTDMNGHIDHITFKEYDYRDIDLAGNFKESFFDGDVAINDSNALVTFHGEMDFRDSLPKLHFYSDILHADFRALHLLKDTLQFTGKLDINMTGNSLDNFLGDARLFDIDMFENQKRIAFDTVVIRSSMENKTEKLLTLEGNEISGYVRGDFQPSNLYDVFQFYLNKHFPNKFKPIKENDLRENMDFSFQFGEIDKIIGPFLPNITGLEGGSFSGHVNTATDSLRLQLNIDHSGYKDYQLNDLRLAINANEERLTTENSVDEIYFKDSLVLPQTEFRTTTHRDTSLLSLNTIGSTAFNEADVKVNLIFLKDGFYAKILKSALFLNNKDWHISPDNEMWVKKEDIRINNFKISHNNQQILLTSSENLSEKNTFLIQLKDLYVDEFTSLFIHQTTFDGIANGEFQIIDLLDNLKIEGGLSVSELRVNEDSIGLVKAKASYDKKKETLQWDLNKSDDPRTNFSIKGLVGLGKNEQLNGDFKFNHTDINFLNPFIDEIFSDIDGTVTGTLSLEGNRKNPELVGSLDLENVGFLVNYTKVHYRIEKNKIQFKPGEINVGSSTVKDDDGRTGTLTGSIRHQNFQNLVFDLHLNTNGLEMINTTPKDNALYYGKAYGSGRVDFTGPMENMQMVINTSPLEGTKIFLPLSDSKDIGKHDFIIFKEYGKPIDLNARKKQKSNLSVKLFAEMNPQAKIDVIVDAVSGDHIMAQGNGALQMNVSANGDFQMFGNYAITEGSYIFSFKGLLSRRFIIKEGSAISWNGDPTDANINIDAVYRVPGGANLYNLVADDAGTAEGLTREDRQLLRQRETIDVYLSLKNSLAHPDITYDIQIPEASISTTSLAATRLQQIRQNPDVLINQVAALLAAGQFIPITSGNSSANILVTSGLSTAGQWVSGQLTGILNNLFGNQLDELGLSFSVDYNAYSTLGNYGDLQRNDVQFNVSKGLFNNRIKLEAGPSINWGNSNTPQADRTSYFAGDFRLEYLITPGGRVRFLAFSRNNYNVLLNQNLTRAGLGISYNRSFDEFLELFRRNERRKIVDSIIPSIETKDSIRVVQDSSYIKEEEIRFSRGALKREN